MTNKLTDSQAKALEQLAYEVSHAAGKAHYMGGVPQDVVALLIGSVGLIHWQMAGGDAAEFDVRESVLQMDFKDPETLAFIAQLRRTNGEA